MIKKYVQNNAKALERLRSLVKNISDNELKLVINKEGWTIAAALGHLAFWDTRRLILLRNWEISGVMPSSIDENVINDSLLPFLKAITPRKVVDLAIATAEKLDRKLEMLSPELIKSIEAMGDEHALDRSIHRNMHLDEIDIKINKK